MAIAVTVLARRVSKVILDALTDTGDNFSSVYALPHVCSLLTWQSIMDGAPSAISLKLWFAMSPPGFDDPDYTFALADLKWYEADASTETDGEMRNVAPVNAKFFKVEQLSRTDGTSVTVEVTVQ